MFSLARKAVGGLRGQNALKRCSFSTQQGPVWAGLGEDRPFEEDEQAFSDWSREIRANSYRGRSMTWSQHQLPNKFRRVKQQVEKLPSDLLFGVPAPEPEIDDDPRFLLDKPFFTRNPQLSTSGERRCYALTINCYHKNKNAIDLKMLRMIKTYLMKYDLSVWYTSALWKPRLEKQDLVPGADLRAIYESIVSNTTYARQFFKEQAEAVYAVATTRKPLIPILRGNVVGLGAGFALNCLMPVATPTTAFAVPGCMYGWTAADSGMSYTLSRLPGYIGEYLALTGKRVCGSDVYHLGLAHFYLDVKWADPTLETVLSAIDEHNIHRILETLQRGMSPVEPFRLQEFIPAINRCFGKDSVEDIIQALKNEQTEWATNVVRRLEANSPLSLKITLRAIRLGRQLSRENCLQMEYAIHSRLLREHDFLEGIKTHIVDRAARLAKTKETRSLAHEGELTEAEARESLDALLNPRPRWRQSLAEVTDAQLDSFFRPLPEAERLNLVPTRKSGIQPDVRVEFDRAFMQERATRLVQEARDYIVANTTPAEQEAIFFKNDVRSTIEFIRRELQDRPQILTFQDHYHEDLKEFLEDFEEDIPSRTKSDSM